MNLERNQSDFSLFFKRNNQDYNTIKNEVDVFIFNNTPILSIRFDIKSLPISWFITNNDGDVVVSGNSIKSVLNIGLSHFEKGVFTLRFSGEKFIFEL